LLDPSSKVTTTTGANTMNNIDKALEILNKGPSAQNELNAFLKRMTQEERIALASIVQEMNIPAPNNVFYDYENQKWLIG